MEKEYNLKVILPNVSKYDADTEVLLGEQRLNQNSPVRFHISTKENPIKALEDEKPPYNTEVIGYNKEWIDPDYNHDGSCICFMYDDETWCITKWCGYHDEWHTRYTEDEDVNQVSEHPNLLPPTHWTYKPKFK